MLNRDAFNDIATRFLKRCQNLPENAGPFKQQVEDLVAGLKDSTL